MNGTVSHAAAAELELYVIDGLAADPRRRLEQHLVACDHCARLLAAEAAAEMELRALWPEVQQVRRPLAAVVPLRAARPAALLRPAPVRPSAGGLAVAAVALLFVGWGAIDAHRRCSTTSASTVVPGGACLASRLSARASEEPADGPLCPIDAPPAPAGLASWAACVAPRR
jgi:hypothetical protein